MKPKANLSEIRTCNLKKKKYSSRLLMVQGRSISDLEYSIHIIDVPWLHGTGAYGSGACDHGP